MMLTSKCLVYKGSNNMRYTLLLSLAVISGCAEIRVYPVSNSHGSKGINITNESDRNGVRFNRPEPHIWVTEAGADKTSEDSAKINMSANKTHKKPKNISAGYIEEAKTDNYYTAKIVYLPNYEEEYLIEWTAGLGSVDPHFTLGDGWNLVGFDSSVDSKFSENITAISGLISAATKGGASGTNAAPFDGPGLYKLQWIKSEQADVPGHFALGAKIL